MKNVDQISGDSDNLTDELLVNKIYLIRNQKVMLDEDLAELYGISTRRLNEQVKRNISRFPSDFMFSLTDGEFSILMSQFATSRWGGRRKLPNVFTEHGVLMLSSVLNSKRAIQVNLQIMRVYVRIREMLFANKEALIKMEQVEKQLMKHDEKIELLFNYLSKFLTPEELPRTRIGYKLSNIKEA